MRHKHKYVYVFDVTHDDYITWHYRCEHCQKWLITHVPLNWRIKGIVSPR